MSNNPRGKKNENYPLKITMSILIAAILFVADLYIMINQPSNVVFLVIITVLLLVAIYLILDSGWRLKLQKEERLEEQYDNIFKSEKASYLLLRKTFDDISQLIQNLDMGDVDFEEVINAQKAIAKLTISRSKENTDALMNFNDEMMEKILELEKKIDENQVSVLALQKQNNQESNLELLEKQDKLFIELNGMEASVKDSLIELSEKVAGFQTEIEKMADSFAMPAMGNMPVVEEVKEPEVAEKVLVEEPEFIEEPEPIEESEFTEESEEATETSSEDAIDAIMKELAITEEPEFTEETEESTEESATETSSEDALDTMMNEFAVTEEPEFTEESEETTEELVTETSSEEPEIEAEPEVIEQPEAAEEEKPSMPDMSDPHKIMSPEEIAALIANM